MKWIISREKRAVRLKDVSGSSNTHQARHVILRLKALGKSVPRPYLTKQETRERDVRRRRWETEMRGVLEEWHVIHGSQGRRIREAGWKTSGRRRERYSSVIKVKSLQDWLLFTRHPTFTILSTQNHSEPMKKGKVHKVPSAIFPFLPPAYHRSVVPSFVAWKEHKTTVVCMCCATNYRQKRLLTHWIVFWDTFKTAGHFLRQQLTYRANHASKTALKHRHPKRKRLI